MRRSCAALAFSGLALLAVALGQGVTPPAPMSVGQAQQVGSAAGDAASTAVSGTIGAIQAFGTPTLLNASTSAGTSIQGAFMASANALAAGLLEISGEVQNAATGLTNALVTLITATSQQQTMAAQMAQAAQVFANRARTLAGQVTQATIVFASAFVQSSVMVTNVCGNCSATVTSSAFAIQLGGMAEAYAFASANCTVTCVAASQNALNNGALESGSAGAANAAALTLFTSTAVASGSARAISSLGNVSTTTNSTVTAGTRAVRLPVPPIYTPGQRATLAVLLQASNATSGAHRYAIGVYSRQAAALLRLLSNAATEANTIATGFVNTAAAAGAAPSALTALTAATDTAGMAIQAAAAGNPMQALSGIADMAQMQTQALNQAAQVIAMAPVAPAPSLSVPATSVPNVARGVPAPATAFQAGASAPVPVRVAPTVSTAALDQAIAPLANATRPTATPPRAPPPTTPPPTTPPPSAATTQQQPVLPRAQAPTPTNARPPASG